MLTDLLLSERHRVKECVRKREREREVLLKESHDETESLDFVLAAEVIRKIFKVVLGAAGAECVPRRHFPEASSEKLRRNLATSCP